MRLVLFYIIGVVSRHPYGTAMRHANRLSKEFMVNFVQCCCVFQAMCGVDALD